LVYSEAAWVHVGIYTNEIIYMDTFEDNCASWISFFWLELGFAD
jgi:hypothetical protein